MGFTAAGTSPTQTSTTQLAPLGFEMTIQNGDKGLLTYIYVHNPGALVETAMVVQRIDSGDSTDQIYTYKVAKSDANAITVQVVGVTHMALPAASYGFVVKKGIVTVTGQAAVVHNQPLKGGSAVGTVIHDDADSADQTFGQTLGGAASATTFDAYVNCMG
tara:strand:+ start:96 stop:578 length:483 start_codon:yes stop_codon:yes gene_type:complete